MKRWQNVKAIFIITMFYLVLEWGFGITCPILFLTGISCAGCGMSRAWLCVFHMDIDGAFQYHPLFWMLPVGLVFFLFWDKIPTRLKNILLISACVLFLAVYIFRMLDATDSVVVFQPENGAIVSLISRVFTNR